MYRPVLTTAPSVLPITLTEAKAQLDVSYTDKDTQISALIAAATSHLDGYTGVLGRCLGEQSWRQDFDDFAYCLPLPLAPIISITSVKYLDTAGAEQTVAGANYSLVTDESGSSYVRFIETFSIPAVKSEGPAVMVAFKAGYATTGTDPNFVSTVPAAIKQAILLLVRHWFDNPGAVVVGVNAQKLPFAVDALLTPWRRIRL